MRVSWRLCNPICLLLGINLTTADLATATSSSFNYPTVNGQPQYTLIYPRVLFVVSPRGDTLRDTLDNETYLLGPFCLLSVFVYSLSKLSNHTFLSFETVVLSADWERLTLRLSPVLTPMHNQPWHFFSHALIGSQASSAFMNSLFLLEIRCNRKSIY